MILNYMARSFDECNGYGRWATRIARALVARGIEIMPVIEESFTEMPGWMRLMAGVDASRLTLAVSSVDYFPSIPGRVWLYTMYENATDIPSAWVETINEKIERVIVPCPQNKEALEHSGVTVPVHVVGGGIDPREFPEPLGYMPNRPYTFMCLGDRGWRKGMETVWQAFSQAFPQADYADVRLIIKCRKGEMPGFNQIVFSDRRISLWREDVPDLRDVYSQADCYVFPTKGEGWGLPPREAAACGLPAIVTDFGGTAVGLEHWGIPIKKYELAASDLESPEKLWVRPDTDEVGQHMKWCYDNRTVAKARAMAGAKWLRENQTWDHSACELIRLMEVHAGWQR